MAGRFGVRLDVRRGDRCADQPANAGRLESIGVGRHLPAHLPTPDEIREALLEVTSDPQVRLRVNAVRDEIHASGGPAHAADAVVERVLTGRW